MRFLLDFIYLLAALLASPYLLYKFATQEKYRAGFRERLGRIEPREEPETPCLWVHGVSVGEVLAAKPFIEACEKALPGWEIVISSTTNTGHAVAEKKFPEHRVIYYPLDLSRAVRRVVDAMRPSCIVLVELEIWPNFLDIVFRRDIPVILVNGRISEHSYNGYRYIRWLLFKPLKKIRWFLVQTEEYAERFRGLGVPEDQIRITGNMKYDNQIRFDDVEGLETEMRRSLGLRPEEQVLIAGSTHHPEEKLLLGLYAELRTRYPDLRLILVPRHPERLDDVSDQIVAAGFDVRRRTKITEGETVEEPVILVDTMGELSRIYSVGTVVFVGGSLIPHGGQNMLEPAGLGKAVLFGPHTHNFRGGVNLLLSQDAAIEITDADDLKQTIERLLEAPEERRGLGERARAAVHQNEGATARNIEILKEVTGTDPDA